MAPAPDFCIVLDQVWTDDCAAVTEANDNPLKHLAVTREVSPIVAYSAA